MVFCLPAGRCNSRQSVFFVLLFKNIFILKYCGVTLQQQQEQEVNM